ncbi:MAG: hypothetical protein V3U37_06315 [Nitrospinaceae bacterium]
MAINAEWVLPIGLVILGTILFFRTRNTQSAPVKIKKSDPHRH